MNERMFPMQRGPAIPWSVAEKIYALYSAMFTGQSLERLAERGGFGWAEVEIIGEQFKKRFGDSQYNKIIHSPTERPPA